MNASPRAMHVFVSAVDMKSFAAAAKVLRIDPSAVSRTIKVLEEELGVALFARSTRTLRLTSDGAQFYRDCVEILQKWNEATRRFLDDRLTPRGQLVVGMGPALTRRMLMQVLPSFLKKNPKIKIVLVNVDTTADFEERGVDVLLRGRSIRQQGGQRPEPPGLV